MKAELIESFAYNNDSIAESIAQLMGISNSEYIQDKIPTALSLYKCDVNPTSCNSESFLMANKCIINKDECGLNYMESLNNAYTHNQINDFNIILLHLREMFKI